MKNWTIILISILFVSKIYGQKDSSIFFNEYSLSINQSNLNIVNSSKTLGFGLGAYHSFSTEKTISGTFGFEFNSTKQFIKNMYEGHFSNSSNLTYYINSVSIPILARLNMGHKTKLFIETGLFLDLNINGKRKGTMETYLPNQSNQIEYKKFDINEKANISSPNFGPSLGIGLKIPILKHELIIKTDCKLGLRALDGSMDKVYNSYIRLMLCLKYRMASTHR